MLIVFILVGLLIVTFTLRPARAQTEELDTNFGIQGQVLTDFPTSNDVARAIAAQPNGYVVASSNGTDFILLRYRSDGQLDASFGGNATNGVV